MPKNESQVLPPLIVGDQQKNIAIPAQNQDFLIQFSFFAMALPTGRHDFHLPLPLGAMLQVLRTIQHCLNPPHHY
jgi:hypothetical protein